MYEEEEFLEDLQELHDALSTDYILEDDDPELNGMKISLSALFEGGLDLAKLLPAAEGDQFVSDQLTDPTLGGILPGATYANNEVLKELRESLYEEELVLGQRVLPDTLEEALAEFDPDVYLKLNEDVKLEVVSAQYHFEMYGYREGRRYFYYPYEIEDPNNGKGSDNGEDPNKGDDNEHDNQFAPHGLANHQSISSGIIKELGDFQFSQKSYYLDSSTVVINDLSQGEPGLWRTVSYEFKAIDNDSALVTVFEKDGSKTITTVNYTETHYQDNGEHEDSGDIEVTQIDAQGGIFFSNAVGQWACRDLDVSEIPSEYLLKVMTPDDKDHHSDEISIYVSGGQNTSTSILCAKRCPW